MITGTRVKVKNQDITGTIVKDYGNIVIIKDDDAEMWIDEFDDGTLEYRKSELEIIGFVDPRGYKVNSND